MEDQVYNKQNIYKIGPYSVGDGTVKMDNQIDAVVVINLSCRPEKREKTIKTLNGLFPYRFYTAVLNNNPKRGNLESHINVLKWAKDQALQNVLILEDDIILDRDLKNVPTFPKDWNMIYLGGLCTHVTKWGHPWVAGHFYCGHAYIVHESLFDEIIRVGWQCQNTAIDEYYAKILHKQDNVKPYMITESYIVQEEGWSDLDHKNKWKGFKWPKVGEMFSIP